MKNSSYYIAPAGDRTHDLPHTVASNMDKVSHALTHSATAAVLMFMFNVFEAIGVIEIGVTSLLIVVGRFLFDTGITFAEFHVYGIVPSRKRTVTDFSQMAG